MDFYVYLHKKKTTGEVFYVGKGKGYRANATGKRNNLWKKIAKKHGVVVEIYRSNLQEWYALELEAELIALYGRIDCGLGTLANLTDGGESMSAEGHPRYDRTIYTFYNVKTDETISTTRVNFKRLYPKVGIEQLFMKKNKNSLGWVVKELVTQEDINSVKANYQGKYSKKSDKTIYDFVNIETGLTVSCTRLELLEADSRVSTSHLVNGLTRVSYGWVLKNTYETIPLADLLNPVSGELGGLADLNSYDFKNLVTEESFTGTRSAFRAEFGIDPFTLFLSKNTKLSVKNWCLTENIERVMRTPRRDYTFYTVEHKSGETYSGTRHGFTLKYGYSLSKLFSHKSPQQTCNGWKLVDNSLAILPSI